MNRVQLALHMARSRAHHALRLEYTTYRKGDRVELVKANPPDDRVPDGTRGTVKHRIISRQLFVEWDNGRVGAVTPGKDEIRRVEDEGER